MFAQTSRRALANALASASASVLAIVHANVRATVRAITLTLLAGALTATQAFAQAEGARPFAAPTTTTSPAPSGVESLGTVTLALALVLAVIFVAAWLLRRVRGLGRTGTGALDIIADLPVGQKERAVLIRVGTTQVLIGVAPGRVSTLHVLAEPVTIAPPSSAGPGGHGAERPDFKSLLMKSLGK